MKCALYSASPNIHSGRASGLPSSIGNCSDLSSTAKPDIVAEMRISCLAFLSFAAFTLALAQSDPGTREYETRCARCHGADATGGESGPNIEAQIAARSASELAAFLRVGRPVAGMPAFALPAQEMKNLVGLTSAHSRPCRESSSRYRSQGPDHRGPDYRRPGNQPGNARSPASTGEKQFSLLRKAGDRYRVVTSQTDWPSYNGDPSGNRYTKLTQINKNNVHTPHAEMDVPDAQRIAGREHARGC